MDYDLLLLELMDNEVWGWDEVDKLKSDEPPVTETVTPKLLLMGVGQ